MQRSSSYTIGFSGGRDDLNDKHYEYYTYSPDTAESVGLLHQSADFLHSDWVPKIGFHFISCSFLHDWNLQHSMLRSLLAPVDYGVASVWTRADWILDPMMLGDTLGSVLVHNVQGTTGHRNDTWGSGTSGPTIAPDLDSTFNSIMGDPTLRLNFIRPPSNLVLSGQKLQWSPSSDTAVNSYYVYKYDIASGTYVHAESVSQPTSIPQGNPVEVTLGTADLNASSYMVRATKVASTGIGSYSELSEGAIFP